MFGPTSAVNTEIKVDYCHRSRHFFTIYAKLQKIFKKKFNLTNYDVLFIPGSATVGIEAVMFSTKQKIKVIGHPGNFTNRWKDMAKHYNIQKKGAGTLELYCMLETSISKFFEKPGCIVDGVSGFPYKPIPKNTKVFVTCLNKQLGSLVGLSVVCIKKDFWKQMITKDIMSYLNLARYKDFALAHQTPATSPSYVFEHAYKMLSKLDIKKLRERINRISDKIVKAVGKDNIIGEKRCPVISVKKNAIPKALAKKYNLYGYWIKKDMYQIYTYSFPEKEYNKFLTELSKHIK